MRLVQITENQWINPMALESAIIVPGSSDGEPCTLNLWFRGQEEGERPINCKFRETAKELINEISLAMSE